MLRFRAMAAHLVAFRSPVLSFCSMASDILRGFALDTWEFLAFTQDDILVYPVIVLVDSLGVVSDFG